MTTTDIVTRDAMPQELLARLLQDEINRLLDRLAGSVPGGTAVTLALEDPTLAARIEAEEARLTGLRAALLDGYRQWGDSLQALEDLWALRALKADCPDRLEHSERRVDRRAAQRPEPRPERRADRRAA